MIGYAEIGRALSEQIGDLRDHPYREWIGEYAGRLTKGWRLRRAHLDELAARSMTEQRFVDLAAIFGQASKLEADFWQMGLDATV